MHRSLQFVAALGLAVNMALPVAAQDAHTVVATVNGTDITLGQMIVARGSLPQQYQSLPNEVLFEGLLSQMVSQVLLAQDYTEELPARALWALENEELALRAGERIDQMLKRALSEEAINAEYALKYANAEPTHEYNASHILVETKEEADDIKKLLDEGGEFAALAEQRSTGPSGPNGGSLGWFGKGAMVPEFEAAVVALAAGEVSEPVQTQFGWHVIILNEERNADVPSLEEVRAEIEAQVREATVDGKIEELRAAADINQDGAKDIDPEWLTNLSLVE